VERDFVKLKIAILTPVYSYPERRWVSSLCDMMNYFYASRIVGPDGNDVEKSLTNIIVTGSDLGENRHKALAEAVLEECTHALWLDADHVFKPDTLNRLLARNVAIVGANYGRRCFPTAPTAAVLGADGEADGLCYTTKEKADANLLEAVAHLGFGVCLMDLRILDALECRAEELGKDSMLPLFKFGENGDGKRISEDVYFFAKCRDAGISVYCDHGVSWDVGHCSEMLITNAMTVMHEKAWEEESEKEAGRYAKQIARLEGSA
jgi:hypothetical protein